MATGGFGGAVGSLTPTGLVANSRAAVTGPAEEANPKE